MFAKKRINERMAPSTQDDFNSIFSYGLISRDLLRLKNKAEYTPNNERQNVCSPLNLARLLLRCQSYLPIAERLMGTKPPRPGKNHD